MKKLFMFKEERNMDFQSENKKKKNFKNFPD